MLNILKLKQGKIYTVPSTGIAIKSGQPDEAPVVPILIITSFTSSLNRSTLGLSFDIYFDIYASPESFFNGYGKIYSSFVSVPESTAYEAALFQAQPGTINLIDRVQELLFQILQSQPEFIDWETGNIASP